MIQTIADFSEWLNQFINFEKKPHHTAFCLETIRTYASFFSDPHTAYTTAHVAGSKGKGSVAAMFSSLLNGAGFSAGVYTSPHVNDFRERITQNGRFFPDEAYIRTFQAIEEGVGTLIGRSGIPQPSWFELVTLAAFVLFRQEQLDWAVFETGMGGRLDATNIVRPAVTLLTPIELEHTEYLGNTISLIAAEKAGIIKKGIPVFCSKQPADALAVFRKQAAALHAPFFYIPETITAIEHQLTPNGLEISAAFSAAHPVGALFKRPLHTVLPLFTPVQADNAVLAAAAFKYLYPEVSESSIETGLSKAWLPARFQILRREPLIVLDGAHTHNSIQACTETFFSLAKEKALVVFACAKDKDPKTAAPLFRNKVAHLYLTVPGSFKKGDLQKIHHVFTRVFESEIRAAESIPFLEADEDFETVLKKAFTDSIEANSPLLITGSFYLAAEAQRIYSAEGFQDREK